MTVEVRTRGPVGALAPRALDELLSRATTVPDEVRRAARDVLDEVAAKGDAALEALTLRFDEVRLEALRVPAEVIEAAHAGTDPETLGDLRVAIDQVRRYHESTVPEGARPFNAAGVHAYERRVPLGTVGVYVPGGRAAYPSTVLMTVVPAQVAGVGKIVVASPPGEDGWPHPLVLAACHELGVEHVVPVGGAQAIAALALGTESVPACQAVVGPGNAYVQAAKELVAGRVRIDAPAGPSEIAVLLGPGANIRVAALEMAAQTEHDPATLAVAVCLQEGQDEALVAALDEVLGDLPRAAIVREALAARGAVLTAGSLVEALGFLDVLAPEHLILLHPEGDELADGLTGPACIVAGGQARVALTDYIAGPSHVLPTGGTAAARSGLGIDTFTKTIHVVVIDGVDRGLVEAGARLARLEGLEAHARSIEGCYE